MDSVVFGGDMSSGEEVGLPLISRMSGTYVVGKNGTGKTSLLLSMMRQDMEQGRGLCFLDPAGDASLELLALVPEHRQSQVRFMDASDERYLFGLNMFHNDGTDHGINLAAGSAVQVFKRAWGGTSWGPNLENTLRNLAYVMAATGGTLADCPDFMRRPELRAERMKRVSSRRVVDYWRHEYEPLTEANKQKSRATILNKIEPYLLDTAVERIVNGAYEQVDFRSAMDSGQILIFRLPEGRLGDGGVALLGATIVEQIAWATRSRIDIPESQRRPFLLFADEFQLFATPVFAKMIEQLRKFGLGVLMAHQRRNQLSEEARDAAMGCRNFVVFEVSGRDSRELSSEFRGEATTMVTPPNLYEILEKKGIDDPRGMTSFHAIRDFLDAYPVQRSRAIRQEGKTPDMLAIRQKVDEQKRQLSRYWAAVQDQTGEAPSISFWNEFERLGAFQVALALKVKPMRVKAWSDFSPEATFAHLDPFTARVKLRLKDETVEHTIKTLEPPSGQTRWKPERTAPVCAQPDESIHSLVLNELAGLDRHARSAIMKAFDYSPAATSLIAQIPQRASAPPMREEGTDHLFFDEGDGPPEFEPH